MSRNNGQRVQASEGSGAVHDSDTDENGKRRKKRGYTDKSESLKLAVKREERAQKVRDGLVDPTNRDASNVVFDFHSARCVTATLADAAGVSPRVNQRLMRHSKEEMTARYTRPRPVDVDAGAEKIPSLKPVEAIPAEAFMTGTDSTPVARSIATEVGAYACKSHNGNAIGMDRQWSYDPPRHSFATTRATR